MAYVVEAPKVVTVPVHGTTDVFPAHRIYCVGRNYAAHAIELGHDPDREPPFFFQKNPDTIVPNGGTFRTQASRAMCTLKWKWSWRLAKAAKTLPLHRHSSMCLATRSAST